MPSRRRDKWAFCCHAHAPALICKVLLHLSTLRFCALHLQYLVFEYVDKNLLEVLEEVPEGFSPEQVGLLWSRGLLYLAGQLN